MLYSALLSIRRAVLRSAASASASVRVAPSPATPLFRSVAQQSAVYRPAALAMAARYFSQTARVANDNEISSENTFQELSKSQDAPAEAPAARSSIEETPYGIFIRNMVFDATESNLKEAFEHYGTVAAVAISRDPRGLSRGYGFVWFETAEAQQKAIEEANGSFWHGRRIIVLERQKTERAQKSRFEGGSSPAAAEPSNTLYIGNLPYETTDADLNVVFRELEGVQAVRVAVDRSTGWPRGFAHADFRTVEQAVTASEFLQGKSIGSRQLRIDYAQGTRGKRNGNSSPNGLESRAPKE
ncbi:nucleic acid-binding protein [Ophiostoma piceae UAMH 11346]|uniref:Nucleic acid-binding protein n=1 Tax=Ophiostoma piceae (strain UAMH 11346) TaxID=1262450 RepID=S3C405_OPHP1|nr:nucleic acid-binding protein [Ophiostoma piceae UAMH 11346]